MQSVVKERGNETSALREIIAKGYLVDGREAICRLLLEENRERFGIEVTFAGECKRVWLPVGFARAAELFEIIVYGTVTPCTLADILEDLLAE